MGSKEFKDHLGAPQIPCCVAEMCSKDSVFFVSKGYSTIQLEDRSIQWDPSKYFYVCESCAMQVYEVMQPLPEWFMKKTEIILEQ